MTDCFIQGLQKVSIKQVNYQRLREQTQSADENLATFLSWLMEVLHKYTHMDPDSPLGQVLINSHFISQSTPDIQQKLKKSNLGPQSPQKDLLNAAFQL